MKFVRNTSGFSIIEALAGITIIATLAVLVTQFGIVRNVSKHGKMTSSCLSVAKSVVERVKDVSVSGRIKTYIPNDGPAYPGAAFDTLDGRMANNAHQWVGANPGSHDILSPTGLNTYNHNAYLLIGSSIRYLTSAYNSNTGLCNNWGNYGNLTAVNTLNPAGDFYVAGDITKEDDPIIQVKVTPFTVTDGADFCTGANIFIKPRNSLAADPAAVGLTFTPAANTFPNPANGNPELGMRLSVQVTYTHEGAQETCETGHDFQYTPDVNPPQITYFEISQNVYNPGVAGPIANQNPNIAANVCNANLPQTNNDVTVMLGMEEGQLEEGVVFFCRDISRQVTFDHDPTIGSGNKACINTNISTTAPARYSLGPAAPPAGVGAFAPTPLEQGPTATVGALLGPGNWVPCHQVTLCGVAPNAATTRVNTVVDPSVNALDNSADQTQRITYQLNYNIISGGGPAAPPAPNITPNPTVPYCQYGLEVIAIDSAGNASSPPTVLADPTVTPVGGVVSATAAGAEMIVSDRRDVNDSFGATLGVTNTFNSTTYSNNFTAPPHCVAPGSGNNATLCIEDPTDLEHLWKPPWNADPRFSAGYYTCLPQCCRNNTFPAAPGPDCNPFKATP